MALYSIQKNFLWTYLHSTLEAFKVKLLGYRTYKALITQTGVTPPTATVLENTLGIDPVYVYANPGEYSLVVNDFLFATPTTTPEGKTLEVTITPSSSLYPATGDDIAFTAYPVFFNIVEIQSYNKTTPGGEDDLLNYFCSTILEIKVYN